MDHGGTRKHAKRYSSTRHTPTIANRVSPEALNARRPRSIQRSRAPHVILLIRSTQTLRTNLVGERRTVELEQPVELNPCALIVAQMHPVGAEMIIEEIHHLKAKMNLAGLRVIVEQEQPVKLNPRALIPARMYLVGVEMIVKERYLQTQVERPICVATRSVDFEERCSLKHTLIITFPVIIVKEHPLELNPHSE
ncbi:hypothetical protein C0995_003792 [Termitomyces sp. Mi166|nr:hypothetical protein C0995_003792 [Termitomyces sp. Mi166\